MFRTFLVFCFGVILGAGGMATGFTYHVVRTTDGVILVPRIEPMLRDAYVDVREWGVREWKSHWTVTKAMLKSGYRRVIEESTAANLERRMTPDDDRTSALDDLDAMLR